MKTTKISTKRYSAENFMLLNKHIVDIPKASEMDKKIAKARKKAIDKRNHELYGSKRCGNKQFTLITSHMAG